ncbi:MAG: ACT domain-containing protein [Candidatus Binatia bacterium]
MKQWFALSAIGRDRPGIVADLAELIYECDCNLEDSSMTILGSEFAVLLLLTGEGDGTVERLSAACKRLEWERRLTVFFQPLDAEPIPYQASQRATRYALQAAGVDKAGIVAKLSRCLADHRVNIAQMQTQSRPEPEIQAPIFTVRMVMEVPGEVDPQALRERPRRCRGTCASTTMEPVEGGEWASSVANCWQRCRFRDIEATKEAIWRIAAAAIRSPPEETHHQPTDPHPARCG